MIDDDKGATTEQIDRQSPFGDRVLLVIDGASLQVVPLPGAGTITIGRSQQCDITVDSGSVSRHHANFHLGQDVEIEDVGSSNGTYVDGARIPANTRIRLGIGIPFLVGGVTLMVQTRAGSRRETPPVKSSQLAALEQSAARIAVGKLSIVVLGETGVGKERFAERIHEMSPRRASPFVRINCAAISEPILETEIFGNDQKPGAIEGAEAGTVFLNDIAELPPTLQLKLLRVIEDNAIRRLGSGTPRPVDVRFIASSSKDLDGEIQGGRFRQDLYFRLAGATFTIPPLRSRQDEVLPLAEQFVASAAGPLGRHFVLADDAKAWLTSHDWPGNIRELRNACERAVLLATGSVIERQHLTIDEPKRAPGRYRSPTTPPPGSMTTSDMPSQVRATVAELEKQRILEALDKCAGNQTRAAELLGISRRTLINRLDEYGIARPRKRDE
ncbi:MAG TPA: sigma 54-interacting transcriptional regulator [Kofleriaceae bacterium]